MPTIYSTLTTDVDIDVEEFLTECSEKEIQQVIKYLKRNDYIAHDESATNTSALDVIYNKSIALTHQEEELINKIANRLDPSFIC